MIRIVSETGSTNDDMAALAREGAVEGTWLRAERQTGGRGRQGRDWHSPAGNLYASTLVRLQAGDPPAPTLALVAAIALYETLSLAAPDVDFSIKWPNDLLAPAPAKAGTQKEAATGLLPSQEHKDMRAKLGGILLERAHDAVVVGLGANLAHHPEGLERPVTSVAALTGSAPEPSLFLEILAESFARWLARWRSEGVAPIRNRWLLAAHPVGTALSTSEGEGLFDGLTEAGSLRLRLADGTARVIHAGDVFLI